MNGVEILNTIPIGEVSLVLYFSVTLFVAIVGLIISYILLEKEQFAKSNTVLFVSVILSLSVAVFMINCSWFQKPTGEYKYEVKTTEECKLNEFKNKYEILEEKNDNIYIVKEKTIEE